MAELQEARKIYSKNLKAVVEDKRSKKKDRRTEDRSRHEQSNGGGPRSPPRSSAHFEWHTPFNTKKETIIRDIYHLKLAKYPANAGKQKLLPNAGMSNSQEVCIPLHLWAYYRGREVRVGVATLNGEAEHPQSPKGSTTKLMSPEGSLTTSPVDLRESLHDSVVISVIVGNFIVKKVLVNQGSSIDILFYSTFEKMQLTEASLTPCKGDLVGFSGEMIDVRKAIWLRTTFNSQPKEKTIDVQYLIIMILGQPSLNTLGAVVSSPHSTINFFVSEIEVGVLHAD
ncbi:hypothetical protein Cni_G29287 [Canna indica]|uniref:Uncharacterized protein n=1 Tax=Canna indica TaxID=4628 RepID=A0AAQ3L6Y7_9LILI|nr:hypothetical protein Cni_G29287 [Canna indica]